MAAGVALRRSTVWLLWISLGYFTCLYWAASGVDGNSSLSGNETNETLLNCPNDTNESCDSLPPECLDCGFNNDNFTCDYGRNITVECSPLSYINCRNASVFNRTLNCTYCFLTDPSMYECTSDAEATCTPFETQLEISRSTFKAQCVMTSNELCLGNRTFEKNVLCTRVSSDKTWGAAWALSITLGGFGVDRFYLGHWETGLGKLFTFGGLGIWSIFDIIIIGVGYLAPADGSQFP